MFNAIILALDGYPISERMALIVTVGNELCLLIFSVECALKIVALTFEEYIRNAWNVFDFAIVLMSLLEVCRPTPSHHRTLSASPPPTPRCTAHFLAFGPSDAAPCAARPPDPTCPTGPSKSSPRRAASPQPLQ